MPSLKDVVAECTALQEPEVEWLHLLVADWQLIADLSFADLALWVPSTEGTWVAAAHVRPTTGVGVFTEDLVGRELDLPRDEFVQQAYDERRQIRSATTLWRSEAPVRSEAVPVVMDGRVIAVLTRYTNLAAMRTLSRLEVTYLATADALARMIADGEFPQRDSAAQGRRGAPRVGDGVLRLDAEGAVTYASPNAVSAAHRLGYAGELVGVRLASVLQQMLPERGPVDEELMLVVAGRVPWHTEIDSGDAVVSARAIPLVERGTRVGAVLLVRDISEQRRRERELLTKDATIREIHHRVKNNLQTVAAVLRLQARRLADPAARASLEDAVRRVATIADVHDTLSARLDDHVSFDEIAQRSISAAIELANRSGTRVTGSLSGSFGFLTAEDATTLAMILAELVQNAVEHGFADRGGQVQVDVRRTPASGGGERDDLVMEVRDDGSGLPPDFEVSSAGLGTQIVRSLVTDLAGSISWGHGPETGTVVRCWVRVSGG
ncbi:histidine kinase N-terminal domain-containing protein [Allobranchiibius huperziae]|uniref:histidine kinase n=1 Tax=Allobranchiibius huperziae TaxID=1874116 RepID=A0A853D9T9_9MICO|nr:two-component sensor histidine kinase [Allobranchiibius huperziae]